MPADILIRELLKDEFEQLGELMVAVYGNLPGFPNEQEQPGYYRMLRNIGEFTRKPDTQVLVALSSTNELLGGVVYFSDMAQYGSGGTATREKNASGIRLLGVGEIARGKGVGRALTQACIQRAKAQGHSQIILHTTEAMTTAWRLYQNLGFLRSDDLDFLQQALPVFGFRLKLD